MSSSRIQGLLVLLGLDIVLRRGEDFETQGLGFTCIDAVAQTHGKLTRDARSRGVDDFAQILTGGRATNRKW